MSLEHHAFSPKPEVFRDAVRGMSLQEKQEFFTHDFVNMVLGIVARSYRESEELGQQSDPILDLMVPDEGRELLENHEIRNRFKQAIEQLRERGEQQIPEILETAPTDKRAQLTLLRSKYVGLQQLAPIFLSSFDYFSRLDPKKLEELRGQSMDIRDLCRFFNIDHEAEEDQEDFQVDGAQTMILFNWLRNAESADCKFYGTYSSGQATYVRIERNHIQVNNHSRNVLDKSHVRALNGVRNESSGYGLFISAFYASEIGDTIELDQSPIDRTDESHGYQISITLQRNPSR